MTKKIIVEDEVMDLLNNVILNAIIRCDSNEKLAKLHSIQQAILNASNV